MLKKIVVVRVTQACFCVTVNCGSVNEVHACDWIANWGQGCNNCIGKYKKSGRINQGIIIYWGIN